ncbi:hypothetical protein Forpi1262_v000554 [Fusarium oxysporum f. sp. raphani]|uniref:Uncharacterized protein n=1 Tax=Fusarium oxysporum f. sp. raphani TaxID=96318 RepID=A0A8J5QCZ1_FUSOX|nr:hypothetical protein Forpi1262_v000554 [Fusarium oxysporum f. sp. raphani]
MCRKHVRPLRDPRDQIKLWPDQSTQPAVELRASRATMALLVHRCPLIADGFIVFLSGPGLESRALTCFAKEL